MILKEMLGATPSLEHAASLSTYWMSHSSPSIAANGVQNAQGQQVAMRKAFPLHQLLHTLKAFDVLFNPSGFPEATGKTMAVRLAEAGKK